MAAGNFTQYNSFLQNLAEGKIDLATDTFVVTLVTGTYSPNVATDSTWASVSADEVATGGGYTQGGVALTSQSVTVSGNAVDWTAAAVSWSSFTATATYGVIVHRAGSTLASTDLLVAYVALDDVSGTPTALTGQGGTLTITPSATGIIQFTHTP